MPFIVWKLAGNYSMKTIDTLIFNVIFVESEKSWEQQKETRTG